MRSYIIPTGGVGGAYITETSNIDYILPVPTYISETQLIVSAAVPVAYGQLIFRPRREAWRW
jgi:hypothetical protein